MTDRNPTHWLTREDLEAVIRRAAELEAGESGDVPEISESDIVRIAGEVGLSESSVRRALAERRASADTGLLRDRGWASRLCGPSLLTVTRTLERPADDVRSEIETFFREKQSLRLVRRTGDVSLWEPDSGMIPSLLRSVDLFGEGYTLAKKCRAVEVRVVPLDEESCQVTLRGDMANERGGWFWGMGVATGGALTAGASIFITGLPTLPDVVALGSPALLGVMVAAARRAYLRSLEKTRLAAEGILDRVEHGDVMERVRPSWRDLLR